MARNIAMTADVGCQSRNAVGCYEDACQSVRGFNVLVASAPFTARASDKSNRAARDRRPIGKTL
jgi:hypothetical protein